MTISEIQKNYREALSSVYDEREARSVTNLVFEKILELQSHKISLEKFRILTAPQIDRLNGVLQRLLSHEPVQYILEEADFYGLKFKVNKHVLIPRPETEELVAWVKAEVADLRSKILDIGTGSGCIPISLAKEFPEAEIEGVDISEEAVLIATENNNINRTKVKFERLDILNEGLKHNYYDFVISNPPYIGLPEAAEMAANVLKFEPHLALFAPAGDDLIFYRQISDKGFTALKAGGKLFFEINYLKGEEVTSIMEATGFKGVELRKDINGKNRMIKGEK